MTNLDTLFNQLVRSAFGYESLANIVHANEGFPPYNIVNTDSGYILEVALAGFSPEDVNVNVTEDNLIIESAKVQEDTSRQFKHRGIAKRQFKLTFALGPHVVVSDAAFVNGMLSINLAKELPPKPEVKQIPISTTPSLPSPQTS